ncbi:MULTISPECIES: tyrosine-type recombinase/integrase [unclassified Bacillus (in: firmicutes)]|uniref:tyrosine-type recombinase/integrase n=1 Tax=unclassified Bacillus (in: firmicutes) TaxID=185979 RepID=UPI000E35EC92|nr:MULTISPECIES: tyrosine-type recombinase/integrase [unclassified Bacillus (in: firmicutes)]AXR17004.1 integrase [Bacillus sp. CR71]AXR22699.1 integrase [Bacillus sp. E25]
MSLGYFNEKENVRKRQPHKRKAERITKENTVERLFERFLEVKVKQNLRPKSLNQFVLMFNSIKAFHNEKSTKAFYLSDITTNFISDWVGWLKNEYVRYDGHAYMPKTSQTVGLSDETIATRIKRLKTFINWCLKEALIKQDPFIKFEGFRKDSKEIDILTKDELNRLLKVAKSYSNKSYKHFRDYVLLHLLIDGMFRITEALLLSPLDIDHDNKTTIIRSNNAKSRKARVVPLSNKTYRLLMQLLDENEAFEGKVDDLIFLSLSGRMLSKNNVLRDMRKYAVEAGITKRFYLHLIRHSAATHYLSTGDIESLRKILGHSDLRMVLHYAHMADNTVQEKHAKSGFFGSDNIISRKRNNKRK